MNDGIIVPKKAYPVDGFLFRARYEVNVRGNLKPEGLQLRMVLVKGEALDEIRGRDRDRGRHNLFVLRIADRNY